MSIRHRNNFQRQFVLEMIKHFPNEFVVVVTTNRDLKWCFVLEFDQTSQLDAEEGGIDWDFSCPAVGDDFDGHKSSLMKRPSWWTL